MTTIRKRCAMVFPEFQTDYNDYGEISLFSERSLKQTEKLFFETKDSFDGLLGLVVELNRTKELEKQISLQKTGIDVSIEESIKQLEYKYQQETKRMRQQLNADKEKLRLEIEKLDLQIKSQKKQFDEAFEEKLKCETLFQELIHHEFEVLKKYQQYVSNLPDFIKSFREYIIYCDIQKKAFAQINKYLAELI